MSGLFSNWKKKVCIFTTIGTSQFLVLTILAMILYPGGYLFWDYHFSDLGAEETPSGEKNGFSKNIWTATVLITSSSLIFFFIMMATLFYENLKQKFLSFIGSSFGLISIPLLAGVGIFPTDTHGSEHDFSQMYFFLFFSLAIMSYSAAILIKNEYFNGYGIFGIILATVAILYAMTDLFDFISTTLQKVLVFSYILWALVQTKPAWELATKSE